MKRARASSGLSGQKVSGCSTIFFDFLISLVFALSSEMLGLANLAVVYSPACHS
jgi:hypothetical protein